MQKHVEQLIKNKGDQIISFMKNSVSCIQITIRQQKEMYVCFCKWVNVNNTVTFTLAENQCKDSQFIMFIQRAQKC